MPVSLARLDKMEAAAKSIAAALRADASMHQEAAAIAAGLHVRSYWRYMDGDDEASRAFQAIVLPALHEQAAENMKKAEQDIACCENGSGAWAGWHKWKLEKKYRKIYGDLAQVQRVEVSGPNGGPIETAQLSDEEIARRLAALAGGKDGGGDE